MTTKQQIIENERLLLEAMQTNDIVSLDSLIHDDLLFNTPDGQTITKKMDLDAYRSGKVNFQSLTPTEMQISEIGDTIIVAVTVEIKGEYFDQKVDNRLRYLRIWKLFGNSWKVIAGSGFLIGEI
jgi:ketosteroid isomerase-like protein